MRLFVALAAGDAVLAGHVLAVVAEDVLRQIAPAVGDVGVLGVAAGLLQHAVDVHRLVAEVDARRRGDDRQAFVFADVGHDSFLSRSQALLGNASLEALLRVLGLVFGVSCFGGRFSGCEAELRGCAIPSGAWDRGNATEGVPYSATKTLRFPGQRRGGWRV